MKKGKFKFIIGTRAEAIKLKPLIDLFNKEDVNNEVYITGQHDLSKYNFKNSKILYKRDKTFFKSITPAIFFILKLFFNLVKKLKRKDVIIVQGDTMATACGALAGKLKGAKIYHIEAGLRSKNLFEPFPEEMIRRFVDFLSNYHFTTLGGLNNINSKQSYLVGNTVIDNLVDVLDKNNIKLKDDNFFLITIHRQENLKNKKRMECLVNQIKKIKYKSIFIIHKNTEYYLKKYNLWKTVLDKCIIKNQMEYISFISLLAKSSFVISDSGGLVEECCYLQKPIHIYRKYCERDDAVKNNIATMGFNIFDIFQLDYNYNCKYLYGDGTASEKIFYILKKLEHF